MLTGVHFWVWYIPWCRGDVSTTFPIKELVRRANPRSATRRSFAGVTASRLAAILSAARRGDVESWAELAQQMCLTDLQIRALVDVKNGAITSSDWEVKPGPSKPEDEVDDTDQRAADFIRWCLENQGGLGLEDWHAHLLTAEDIGWSGGQQWYEPATYRGARVWVPHVEALESRDIRFGDRWVPEVRSYLHGSSGVWQSLEELPPDTVFVHTPWNVGQRPTVSGTLFACAWVWLFKFVALQNMQIALGRHATPFMYGVVPNNTPKNIQQQFLSNLENLSAGQTAVFELAGTDNLPVQVLEMSAQPGTAHADAIKIFDNWMSKAIVGSTLLLEPGEVGSRSLGEAINDASVLPKLLGQARRLARTERRRYEAILRVNRHLFGGEMPAVPTFLHKLMAEEEVVIAGEDVDGARATLNEWRATKRLEPAADPRADQLIRHEPPQPAAFSRQGAAAPRIALERLDEDDEGPGRLELAVPGGRFVAQSDLPDYYVWRSMRDGDVRHEHRILDGQVFRWDDPPVATKDGLRLHPGQPWGCRCRGVPLSDAAAKKRLRRQKKRALTAEDLPDAVDAKAVLRSDDFEVRDQEWGDKAWKTWLDDIDFEEWEAVQDYAGWSFERVNSMLRKVRRLPPDLRKQYRGLVKKLDAALDKAARTPSHALVFRGMDAHFVPDGSLVPGATFTDPGFVSTSISSEATRPFLQGAKQPVLFQIEVPAGAKAGFVGVGKQGGERELLLPRGSKFEIVSTDGAVDPVSGARILRMRLVTE